MRLAILALAPIAALIAMPAFADPAPSETDKAETAPASSSQPMQKPAESADNAEPKPKAEKRICRHIRTDLSSRRKTKVCRTNAEWREINRGN